MLPAIIPMIVPEPCIVEITNAAVAIWVKYAVQILSVAMVLPAPPTHVTPLCVLLVIMVPSVVMTINAKVV